MEKISFCLDGQNEQDFYAISQTVIGGKTYILVTDSEEGDGEAFILRDDSNPEEEDGLYSIVEDDDELSAVGKIFEKLLADDGIGLDM
ncbi:DUF1292 domain-containing protein [Butyrivibrio sp. NC3005]|uniref:DUF1292 domain-containing protein n=1 Tax=Butyrivibrio sp. NC3005 TaxID=1280685 RepID=UPI0004073FC8|nr:DUF1292 domain-containing protein [Butyrivibrio sp. NC3005]